VRFISILLLPIILLLAGCKAASYGDEVYAVASPPPVALAEDVPLYPELGWFNLNESIPTIDALLDAFSRNARKTFKDRGLKYSYVEIYPGRAWCDLSFKVGMTSYLYGVQFVQNAGHNVLAVVRNMRTSENYPVDYKVLEINPKLYDALLDAQNFKPVLPVNLN